ncbi:MAG: hypothetical protein AAF493_25170 [Pseudomonadota bacterium]
MRCSHWLMSAALPLSLALAPQVNAGDQTTRLVGIDNVQIGRDNNSFENPVVQPQDPAQSGGGRDQSMQFGDVLYGTRKDDLQIGNLGNDILLGRRGDDVQIGGLEHFTGGDNRRDRAFGGHGNDIFIWKPGDAPDFIDGGRGHDVVILGIVAEPDGNGGFAFEVLNDGKAGEVYVDEKTGLPRVDVSNSPGFCEVIDGSYDYTESDVLDELNLDHLVRFIIRGEADDGDADGDNGLRITLHLRNVETLICTSRDGGLIDILDLTSAPPSPSVLGDVRPRKLRKRLDEIVQ